jgi:hypothetical protein
MNFLNGPKDMAMARPNVKSKNRRPIRRRFGKRGRE